MKSQFLQRTLGAVGRTGRMALNAVMPPLCPVTQEEIAAHAALGPEGWAALHFVEAPYCRRCGVPFAADYGEDVECPSCIAEPPDFDCARAAVVYDDASHKLIVAFKHSDRTELAPIFAKWMQRAASGLLHSDSLLVPIPLHRRRLAGRRYNQSALLASSLAKLSGARLALDALKRTRSTPPQKNLSADARRRNVAGAFKATGGSGVKLIEDAHIVLIDDVLTTGATLSSAARTLKKAGAASVSAAVLARVVKGGIGAV